MHIASSALGIMKYCVIPGLLAMGVSGCALQNSHSAEANPAQINPERVQIVSAALQARLQLMVVQAHSTPGG